MEDINGPIYNGLRSDLPTTEHYLFGFSGLILIPIEGTFGIHLNIVSQYVLETTVVQPIKFLQVNFFGMSHKPSEVCS